MPISEAIKQWWPLGNCLDLVHGSVEVVADALLGQVNEFNWGPLSSKWIPIARLEGVFESVSVFTNYPTVLFVLPTHSQWSVLWNNCFLCDGFDSLCHCLTKNHGLTTMHWQS